jgi:hypothetical protein
MGGSSFLWRARRQGGRGRGPPDGPLFEVIEADGRRVKRLRVRLPAEMP